MISHPHRCIFVHIPKVAGQSVESFFLNLLGLQWDERAPLLLRPKTTADAQGVPERLAHLTAEQYVKFKYIDNKLFNQYFKFSFVRNPYARAVSLYKYMGFDSWCKFERFTSKELPKLFHSEKRFFVAPQYEYLFPEESSIEADCLVDFVGYFEEIDKDFSLVLNFLHLNQGKLPHINASGKHKRISIKRKLKDFMKRLILSKKIVAPQKQIDWTLFYSNSRSIQNISELYRKDFELFKYSTKI